MRSSPGGSSKAEQISQLAASPSQLKSTMANLDVWAAQMRDVARKGD